MRVTLLIALIVAATPAWADDRDLCPVAWTDLSFRATKLLLGATSEVHLEVVPAASVLPNLARGTPGALAPSGRLVAVLTVDSDLPFGREESTSVWVEAESGRALQFAKRTLGRKPYRKTGRYTENGYHEQRWAPRDEREERAGPEAWTKHRETDVRGAGTRPTGTVLTDAYALLYLLSAVNLESPGERLRVVVLADDRLVELVFTAGELTRRRADYVESWEGGSRRRSGSLTLRRVTVAGSAVDERVPESELDLGFLGMRGSITVFLDPETGVPVEISGNARHIGDITVRLQRVRLASGPVREGCEQPRS